MSRSTETVASSARAAQSSSARRRAAIGPGLRALAGLDSLELFNGCFARLPPTLKTLDLTNVVLQAKDFDEHSLKALRLKDCEIDEEDLDIFRAAGADEEQVELAALDHLEAAWGITTDAVPWPEPEEE